MSFIGRSDADLMKSILPLRICRWDHRVRGVYYANRLRWSALRLNRIRLWTWSCVLVWVKLKLGCRRCWIASFVIRPLPCQVRLHGRSKTDLNKTICFVVGRGVRTGVFFLSRVLLFLCACLALCEISHYLLLCTATQQIAMKHWYLIRPGAVTLLRHSCPHPTSTHS